MVLCVSFCEITPSGPDHPCCFRCSWHPILWLVWYFPALIWSWMLVPSWGSCGLLPSVGLALVNLIIHVLDNSRHPIVLILEFGDLLSNCPAGAYYWVNE